MTNKRPSVGRLLIRTAVPLCLAVLIAGGIVIGFSFYLLPPEKPLSGGERAEFRPPSEGYHPVSVVPSSATIKDAPVVSVESANEILRPSELVLGVVVGDEARAYPINMLTGPLREIVNDTLGGRAIAATW